MPRNNYLNILLVLTLIVFYTLVTGRIKSDESEFDKRNYILLSKSFEKTLYRLLARADYENRPRKYIKDDGSIYYEYKRSKHEPKPSIEKLEYLISRDPNFTSNTNYIKKILHELRSKDINIILTKNNLYNHTAKWTPIKKTIQLEFNLIALGTKVFSEMLNHEVIHVAQSCHSGSFNSNPRLLGLRIENKQYLFKNLDSPLYDGIKTDQKQLELEAYSNQHDLVLGHHLLKKYCSSDISYD
tara:strand:+ start:4926 stop:5651 length:726 start_codon:yes stop_codon:yes gene_type:complete